MYGMTVMATLIHVIIPMTTAMKNEDVLRWKVKNDELVVDIKLPQDMFSAERLLSHSRFIPSYHDEHPKWIALQMEANTVMGAREHIKF